MWRPRDKSNEIFDKKNYIFLSAVNFFQFLVIKTLNLDSDHVSGSATLEKDRSHYLGSKPTRKYLEVLATAVNIDKGPLLRLHKTTP